MDSPIYRVAVASSDSVYVNMHFGRADRFLIVDVDEEGGYEIVETRRANPVCLGGYHEKDTMKRGVEALLDCNYVLAARIGDGALAELEEHGITGFTIPGEIDDALYRMFEYLNLLKSLQGSG